MIAGNLGDTGAELQFNAAMLQLLRRVRMRRIGECSERSVAHIDHDDPRGVDLHVRVAVRHDVMDQLG